MELATDTVENFFGQAAEVGNRVLCDSLPPSRQVNRSDLHPGSQLPGSELKGTASCVREAKQPHRVGVGPEIILKRTPFILTCMKIPLHVPDRLFLA